jgi:eukaryotic-like serine/threonine-protein kinase
VRLTRDLVGESLSERYRLVSRIAGGGMGEVYRGHDLLLDRAVAVKVLQPSLANDPELVDRFRMEARAAARLLHPNVVTVYDWGEQDERTYYMVMEYVSGTDLRDVLVSRGSIEPAQAIEITAQLCEALEVAHSVGLVHRDVKPENVLIARTGEVKVADFGIAVIVDADRTAPGGNLAGTLRYLSPEQARGDEATAASDIWSAGALLSECVTGRPPAQGTGPDLLRRRAEEDPVPPSSLVPSLPAELDDIVLRACALHPVNRFESASEMAGALRRAAAGLPSAGDLAELLHDYTSDVHLPGVSTPTTRVTGGAHRRRKARGRLKRLGRFGLVLLIAAALLFAGAKVVPALFGPAMVDIPSVLDMDKPEAAATLRELGLRVDFVGRKDKHEAKGEILDQSPFAGTVEEGTTVTLTVSTGPPKVRVPSLIGLTRDQATAVLEAPKRSMVVIEVKRRYSLKEVGTVIDYSPSAERLPWGSEITLILSKGPQPLEIPDVVGMTQEKATEKLEEAGFSVIPVEEYSDDVEAGYVISTLPEPGSIAPQASELQISISIGPEFEELTLPDVRGMNIGQARAQLEEMGLRVQVIESCEGGTVVQETDPISGRTVYENDRIALFVC